MTETDDSLLAQQEPGWPKGITAFERRYGNLTTRVVTAIVGIPFLLGAIYAGGWFFAALVMILNIGIQLEFYWLAERKGVHPNKFLGIVTGTIFLVCTSLLALERDLDGTSRGVFATLLISLLILFPVLCLTVQLKNGRSSSLLGTAITCFGTIYISTSLVMLFLVRNLESLRNSTHTSDQSSLVFTMAIFVAIWICDSGAYFVGRAIGKHKLFERVSPKKTWEGAIGGGIIVILWMIIAGMYWLDITLLHSIGLGIIVAIVGPLGDLSKSQLKRDVDVKDSSNLIPGHGGVLDRFDSVLFVFPVVLLLEIIINSNF